MIRPLTVATEPLEEDRWARDPVAERYRALFAVMDWSQAPERDPGRRWPGRVPHPRTAYIKALVVKLCEEKSYITDLRRYLVEHPGLVLEVGFRPVSAPESPWGFDVERTVPSARWLRHQQQHLDHGLLRALLAATVTALQAEIPGLGTTVAIDVKHIYAWVRENNPKVDLSDRRDPTRQPPGDPDCRLGVKRRTDQERSGRRSDVQKEYVWGYGTGVVSATDPWYGDVVLAEWTQPFDEHDVTSFHPLYRRAVAALGTPPTNVTADAAFDAWHVYQTCAPTGGIAALRRPPTPGGGSTARPPSATGRPGWRRRR
jgi:hypothetical protein